MDAMETQAYLYKKIKGGIRLLVCRSLDHLAVIPDRIDGHPVLELGDYMFSEYRRETEDGIWSSRGAEADEESAGTNSPPPNLPELNGSRLTELYLPATVIKVGKYAFYNCEHLERLSCHSTTQDWGAGAFTGCKGIRYLDIYVTEGEKSCFQEIVSELRQTLYVAYHGKQEARLVLPEYYEEAVENTPARILETHMHGCGHQYRYCFHQSEFLFRGYDSLFSHVQVQEKEELVVALAVGRLRYPCELIQTYEDMYREYLNRHKLTAAVLAVRAGDMEELSWLFDQLAYNRDETATMIVAAGETGNRTVLSYLMEKQRRTEKMGRKQFKL